MSEGLVKVTVGVFARDYNDANDLAERFGWTVSRVLRESVSLGIRDVDEVWMAEEYGEVGP